MRVVAILGVRNERPYLGNCLDHLIDNGVDFAVVDNDSSDGTVDLLAESRIAPHLVAYERLPFAGSFALEKLLEAKQRLAGSIDADWVIHLDADEIMHSRKPGEPLSSAIERIASEGFTVVDFEEFVFLPVADAYEVDRGSMQPLRHYYHFAMPYLPLMRAYKNHVGLGNLLMGGHLVTGEASKLADEKLVLRHYMFRDQNHAYSKYADRVFAADELQRGWHLDKHQRPQDIFAFPAADRLEELPFPECRDLNRERPRDSHYWNW